MKRGAAPRLPSEAPATPEAAKSYGISSAMRQRRTAVTPISGLRIGTVDPPQETADGKTRDISHTTFTPTLYVRKQVGVEPPKHTIQPEAHTYFKIDKEEPMAPDTILQQARERIQQEATEILNTHKQFLDAFNKYTPYKARPPEIIEIERKRMMNLRYLQAEEEKIRMECTRELIDGVHRRYLPTTIGRRAPIIVDEIQTGMHFSTGIQKLHASRNLMLESQKNVASQIARYFTEYAHD